MNAVVLYANPKDGGFVHGCLDAIAERLAAGGAAVEHRHLKDEGIADCTGCFACLHSGRCVLDDGMNDLCERLRAADALVIGCSVRNGGVTALYKRFYERITYPLIFTGDLTGTHVLSVSAVGKMGGRRATAKLLGLRGTGAYPAGHLFFHTGIPTDKAPADVAPRLDAAADRLAERVRAGRRPGPLWHLARRLDRAVMARLLFAKDPDLYAHVLARYRQHGWLKPKA